MRRNDSTSVVDFYHEPDHQKPGNLHLDGAACAATGYLHDASGTVALKEKLAATEPDVEVEQRLAQLLNMANAIAVNLTPEQKSLDIDSELYDGLGLPK